MITAPDDIQLVAPPPAAPAEFARAFAALLPRKFRRRPAPTAEGQAVPSPSGRLEYGLIANDIEQGVPDAVVTGEDGMKGYSVTDVMTIAIAKIQELENRLVEREQSTVRARIRRASQSGAALWLSIVARLIQISNAALDWSRNNLFF